VSADLPSSSDALVGIALSEPTPPTRAPSRPARGFAYLVGGQLAAKVSRFAAAAILARELSVSSYGLVNVGIAVSGIMAVGSTVGLSDLGARDVAVEPDRARWIAGRVLAVRLLGVLTCGLALVIGAALDSPSFLPLAVVVTLMSLSSVSSAEWLLRGSERMGALGIAETIGGIAVLTGCILLAVTKATPVLAVGVFAVGEAVVAGGCWIAVGRALMPKFALDGLRVMLKRSWPIGVSSIAFYAYYANLDTIILAITRSEREAGLYTAAYRLFLAANLAGIVAAYVQLPILSRAVAVGDDAAASASLKRALYFLACYGTAVVGAVEVGGHVILATLFGSRFVSMTPVLTLLCMGVVWYSVGYPAGYTLIARGHTKGLLAGAATSAVLNVSLDIVLIPLTGPIGAGAATFVAFVAGTLVWMHAHEMLHGWGLRTVAALTIVTLGGFAVLLIPALRVPVGALTFFTAVVFGCVGLDRMGPKGRYGSARLRSLLR
jgi:O-antigen/teichoic acid export membrane protein